MDIIFPEKVFPKSSSVKTVPKGARDRVAGQYVTDAASGLVDFVKEQDIPRHISGPVLEYAAQAAYDAGVASATLYGGLPGYSAARAAGTVVKGAYRNWKRARFYKRPKFKRRSFKRSTFNYGSYSRPRYGSRSYSKRTYRRFRRKKYRRKKYHYYTRFVRGRRTHWW